MGVQLYNLHRKKTTSVELESRNSYDKVIKPGSGDTTSSNGELESKQLVKNIDSDEASDSCKTEPVEPGGDQQAMLELDRIGDSDQDSLLGVDNSKSHTTSRSIRSRLVKMPKQLFSGFIKLFKDLKLFMR